MSKEFTSRGRTGPDKAVNFGTYAKGHGWTGKWSQDETTGITHLFCRRGESETVDIWWQPSGGIISEMLPIYTLAGEKIKCRNVSAAALIVRNEPDTSRLHKAVRKQRKGFGVCETNGEAHRTDKYIKMADNELEQLLFGATVSWINSISGEVQTAEVGGKRTMKVIREVESGARDQVHFVDSFGFHAVYLDAIVSVR